MIALETRFGTIRIELDFDKAPLSARNFQDYVERGFYDGTLFHRVIDGFMIQGGGFTSGLNGKKGRGPIRNEADNGLENRAGTLAMARTADPHSASSQFFINVADNDFLDHRDKTPGGWGYAVFGKVVEGMDVVNQIKRCVTISRGGHGNVPVKEIVIESAKVEAGVEAGVKTSVETGVETGLEAGNEAKAGPGAS